MWSCSFFGKLRSIMAIYWTLAGMEDWANKDWPGVEKNFRMATDLDPGENLATAPVRSEPPLRRPPADEGGDAGGDLGGGRGHLFDGN